MRKEITNTEMSAKVVDLENVLLVEADPVFVNFSNSCLSVMVVWDPPADAVCDVVNWLVLSSVPGETVNNGMRYISESPFLYRQI